MMPPKKKYIPDIKTKLWDLLSLKRRFDWTPDYYKTFAKGSLAKEAKTILEDYIKPSKFYHPWLKYLEEWTSSNFELDPEASDEELERDLLQRVAVVSKVADSFNRFQTIPIKHDMSVYRQNPQEYSERVMKTISNIPDFVRSINEQHPSMIDSIKAVAQGANSSDQAENAINTVVNKFNENLFTKKGEDKKLIEEEIKSANINLSMQRAKILNEKNEATKEREAAEQRSNEINNQIKDRQEIISKTSAEERKIKRHNLFLSRPHDPLISKNDQVLALEVRTMIDKIFVPEEEKVKKIHNEKLAKLGPPPFFDREKESEAIGLNRREGTIKFGDSPRSSEIKLENYYRSETLLRDTVHELSKLYSYRNNHKDSLIRFKEHQAKFPNRPELFDDKNSNAISFAIFHKGSASDTVDTDPFHRVNTGSYWPPKAEVHNINFKSGTNSEKQKEYDTGLKLLDQAIDAGQKAESEARKKKEFEQNFIENHLVKPGMIAEGYEDYPVLLMNDLKDKQKKQYNISEYKKKFQKFQTDKRKYEDERQKIFKEMERSIEDIKFKKESEFSTKLEERKKERLLAIAATREIERKKLDNQAELMRLKELKEHHENELKELELTKQGAKSEEEQAKQRELIESSKKADDSILNELRERYKTMYDDYEARLTLERAFNVIPIVQMKNLKDDIVELQDYVEATVPSYTLNMNHDLFFGEGKTELRKKISPFAIEGFKEIEADIQKKSKALLRPDFASFINEGFDEINEERYNKLRYVLPPAESVTMVAVGSEAARTAPEFRPKISDTIKRLASKGLATPTSFSQAASPSASSTPSSSSSTSTQSKGMVFFKRSKKPSNSSSNTESIVIFKQSKKPSKRDIFESLVARELTSDIDKNDNGIREIEIPEIDPRSEIGNEISKLGSVVRNNIDRQKKAAEILHAAVQVTKPKYWGIPDEGEIRIDAAKRYDVALEEALSPKNIQEQINKARGQINQYAQKYADEEFDKAKEEYETNVNEWNQAWSEINRVFREVEEKASGTVLDEARIEIDKEKRSLKEIEEQLSNRKIELTHLKSDLFDSAVEEYKKQYEEDYKEEVKHALHIRFGEEVSEGKKMIEEMEKSTPLNESGELTEDKKKIEEFAQGIRVPDLHKREMHVLNKIQQIKEAHGMGGYTEERKLPRMESYDPLAIPARESGQGGTAKEAILKNFSETERKHYEMGELITGRKRLMSPLRYKRNKDSGNLVLEQRDIAKMRYAGLGTLIRDEKQRRHYGIERVDAYELELRNDEAGNELIDYTNEFWNMQNRDAFNNNLSTVQKMTKSQEKINKSFIALSKGDPKLAEEYRAQVRQPRDNPTKYDRTHKIGITLPEGIYTSGEFGKRIISIDTDLKNKSEKNVVTRAGHGKIVALGIKGRTPFQSIAAILKGEEAPPPGTLIVRKEEIDPKTNKTNIRYEAHLIKPKNKEEADKFLQMTKSERPSMVERALIMNQTPRQAIGPGGSLHNVEITDDDGTKRLISEKDFTPKHLLQQDILRLQMPKEELQALRDSESKEKNIENTHDEAAKKKEEISGYGSIIDYSALGMLVGDPRSPAMFLRKGRREGSPAELQYYGDDLIGKFLGGRRAINQWGF